MVNKFYSDSLTTMEYPPSASMLVKVGPNGTMPTRGSSEAAGWDLYASDSRVISSGSWIDVPTDIYLMFPVGYYGRIAPRSGLAFKNGINVLAGVIDRDYRGEIKVILMNHGPDYAVSKGDRIAQIIPTAYQWCNAHKVDELPGSNRGEGGFGSTGT